MRYEARQQQKQWCLIALGCASRATNFIEYTHIVVRLLLVKFVIPPKKITKHNLVRLMSSSMRGEREGLTLYSQQYNKQYIYVLKLR